jgi:aspartyl aminopeptidase
VDVGNPMWSMHSVRETAGRDDVRSLVRVLTRFFGGLDPLPA